MFNGMKLFYVKTRLQQFRHVIQDCKMNLLKFDMNNFKENWIINGSHKYYELRFLLYLTKNTNFNTSMMGNFEKLHFEEGLKELEEFREFNNFYLKLVNFEHELFQLYHQSYEQISTPNITNFTPFLTDNLKQEYEFLIEEYNRLLVSLENYPNWKDKIEQEFGNYIQMIFTFHLSDGKVENNPLEQFNKHYFFK